MSPNGSPRRKKPCAYVVACMPVRLSGKPRPDTRHIWLVRALQGRHPSWVFSGTTAAPVHGLSVSFNELNPPMRAVEQHGRTKHTGIVRRVETSVSDAVVVDGIRVTQLLQTVFDCMRWMSFGEGLAVADSALCRGQTEKGQLIEYILSRSSGVRGAPRAYVCALHADGRAENGGEFLSRAVMLELGFAHPELQVEANAPLYQRRPYRLDFAWKLADGRLISGEYDGSEKYTSSEMLGGRSTVDAFTAERQRESRITALDISVLRFTPQQRCDKDYTRRLLATYGVPWVGVPAGLSSSDTTEQMLAKARQRHREEEWVEEHLEEAFQVQLGSFLTTVATYSLLSASTGSSRDAFDAGIRPARKVSSTLMPMRIRACCHESCMMFDTA